MLIAEGFCRWSRRRKRCSYLCSTRGMGTLVGTGVKEMQPITIMCAVAGLMISGVALGQASPANPLSSEVQGSYARVEANIIKAADKMPPEDYTYKPIPDIRTFARVVNHVTEAQVHSCGASNHVDPSQAQKVPPDTADKAVIVEALKASFVECDKAYAALTDANMTEMLQAGPVKRSRLGMLWGNVSHDNEQYATLALYLRLKGLVPPSSEK
jgi:DinB superfamily